MGVSWKDFCWHPTTREAGISVAEKQRRRPTDIPANRHPRTRASGGKVFSILAAGNSKGAKVKTYE